MTPHEFYGETHIGNDAIWLNCPTLVFLVGIGIEFIYGNSTRNAIGFDLHVEPSGRTDSFTLSVPNDGLRLLDYRQILKHGKTFRLNPYRGLLNIKDAFRVRFHISVEDPPDCCVRHRLAGFDLKPCAGVNLNREVLRDVQSVRY